MVPGNRNQKYKVKSYNGRRNSSEHFNQNNKNSNSNFKRYKSTKNLSFQKKNNPKYKNKLKANDKKLIKPDFSVAGNQKTSKSKSSESDSDNKNKVKRPRTSNIDNDPMLPDQFNDQNKENSDDNSEDNFSENSLDNSDSSDDLSDREPENISDPENTVHPDMQTFHYGIPGLAGLPYHNPLTSFTHYNNHIYGNMQKSTNSVISRRSFASSLRTSVRKKMKGKNSPTASSYSIKTTGTFKNEVNEDQFNDMLNNFKENELDNMEKRQVSQELYFMKRVSQYLDQKLYEYKEESKNTISESNKKTVSDLEKNLNMLGIDIMDSPENIQNSLEMIEVQFETRQRQLGDEKKYLLEKLDSVKSELDKITT